MMKRIVVGQFQIENTLVVGADSKQSFLSYPQIASLNKIEEFNP